MATIVTARQVVDAIRQGGLPKIGGEYITYDRAGNPIGGCAYGQAALNLGVDPEALYKAFEKFLLKIVGLVNYYEPHIRYLSDGTDLTLPQIAYRVESWLSDVNVDLDRSRIAVG